MKVPRVPCAIGLAGLLLLSSVPSQGQAPRAGGWLTLRLREDLPWRSTSDADRDRALPTGASPN